MAAHSDGGGPTGNPGPPPSLPDLLDAKRYRTSAEIGAAIETLESTDPVDIRAVFDLKRLRTDLLVDEERFEAAMRANVDLATFAQRHRDLLMEDPAPYYFIATNLSLKLGKIGFAIGLLERLAEEQLSGALDPRWIVETKSWITRLRVEARGARREVAKFDEAAALEATPPQEEPGSQDYSVVDVFYATDRARTGQSYPSRFYGAGRGVLELGRATVSIPRTHQRGVVDAPSAFRLEFSENPVRHVVLQTVTPMAPGDFFGAVGEAAEERRRNEIFVYVHGFNTSFDRALKRAAQIAYDINYQGVPVVYSWPSRGRATGYLSDSAVVRLSARRLAFFLEDLATRMSASRIHLIAHSMGSRAVSDALELICLRRRAEGRAPRILDQLLFAAPDVDADLFREMVPDIRATANRVTLYGSERDWALSASRYLHGDVPRAGQGGDDLIVFEDLDSVDMTEAGDDMLAHSYYAKSQSALLDIATLIWRNTDPGRRYGLYPQTSEHGQSWRLQPDKDWLPRLVQLCATLQAMNIAAVPDAFEIARNLGFARDEEEKLRAFVTTVLG